MSDHLEKLGRQRLLAQETLCRSLVSEAADDELRQTLQAMAEVYAQAARAAELDSRADVR
ncbi:hypothetical protein [Allosphingosinicella deserti]|uniref:Uncharacterized protein n=1 Tax=Allosphingosinicella deserti TaxID=2116704 RepID=A0A2P7QZ45_9SPHN|nr:hypothetical protein [Sphingomonas deserti]PSJ43234.1 hypothetical protein C7I55_02305 [Sphingomonas deserti]